MTAQIKPSATGKYQQSIKTSSCQADMEKKQHAVKGQAEAGRVPRYQRQPQGFRQPAEFIRGPTQRTLWVPPEHCTPVREISIDVEDADFKRGPVKHKKLWTPPSRDNHQHAAAKPQQADRVNTCNQVQARPRTTIHVPQQCVNSETKPTAEPKGDDDMSYLDALNMLRQINGKTCIVVEASTQATTQVPQIEFQQPSVRETEQATTFKTEDKASAAPLEQLEKVQVEPCNEPQQAMIYVSELEHQQFQRQTDRITKLKNGNEALAAEMEQLKKMLQMNQTFHNETKQKRMDDVKDLELQLSEKKASEAEALSKVQELEKALQIQKDRRAEQDILLAQQEEDITKLKTALVQTQDELKRHQLHRQEERSALSEILREAQQVLQEGKAMQEREQQRKRVEKSPSKKGSPSSLSKLEASIPPQSNPPPNYSPSMPTTHPIITPS